MQKGKRTELFSKKSSRNRDSFSHTFRVNKYVYHVRHQFLGSSQLLTSISGFLTITDSLHEVSNCLYEMAMTISSKSVKI